MSGSTGRRMLGVKRDPVPDNDEHSAAGRRTSQGRRSSLDGSEKNVLGDSAMLKAMLPGRRAHSHPFQLLRESNLASPSSVQWSVMPAHSGSSCKMMVVTPNRGRWRMTSAAMGAAHMPWVPRTCYRSEMSRWPWPSNDPSIGTVRRSR